MKIAIYFQSKIDYSFKSLEEGPMPGSETAVLELTKALRQINHKVLILKNIQDLAKLPRVDVLLVKRNPAIVLRKECQRAKKTFFYTPDDVKEISFLPLRNRKFKDKFEEAIDGILALSNYQAEFFIKDLKLNAEKITVIRNGVNTTRFKNKYYKKEKSCICTCAPNKGIDLFLKIWPVIKKNNPSAVLELFSSMDLYNLEDTEKHKNIINKLKQMQGVIFNLPICQQNLAKKLQESKVFLYPNAYGLEVSCISVLEARAAGCVVVTSNKGALKETAHNNILIAGEPGSKQYIKNFIKKTNMLLKNNQYWEKLSQFNLRTSYYYNWKNIAEEVIDIFNFF